MRNRAKLSVSVKPAFFPTLAVSLVLFPVQCVLYWLMAVAIHECFHYAALKYMNIRVFSITISVTGTIMETDTMHPLQEVVSALIGPIGPLVILIFASYFPYTALFICIHSCYNILPLYPLDGGRALHSLVTYLKGDLIALKYTLLLNRIVSVTLMVAVFVLTVRYDLGSLPLMVISLLCLRVRNVNYTLQRQKTHSTI